MSEVMMMDSMKEQYVLSYDGFNEGAIICLQI